MTPIDSKFNKNDSKMTPNDSKFNKNDSKMTPIDSKFNKNDSKMTLIDSKFNKKTLIDSKFNKMTPNNFKKIPMSLWKISNELIYTMFGISWKWNTIFNIF